MGEGEKPGFGPMNTFSHFREFPAADMRAVVRPNFDTLYSSAWLDLSRGPVVVSAPDTGGRYYLLPMLDMWTDVFASPGWRTTGTAAQNYLVTPPSYRPDLKERWIEAFKLPRDIETLQATTPYVWVIGRIKTDGPSDYEAVHKIQDGLKVTPLAQWGKEPQPAHATIDPGVDMKTPPKMQIDTMSAKDYFAYAADLLTRHGPHATDQPILARLRRIGLEQGKPFDIAALKPEIREALEAAPQAAQKLMQSQVSRIGRIENGWSMNTNTMGVYGNYYLKRAIVAQQGLGANVPEDAIYPLNLADSNGKPLDGASKYTIHFAKGALPPAQAFWSITLYDQDGFQVENALNRFALSSWMPLNYNADGSLDLLIQAENPGKAEEANWLPAPSGPFNLTMRLYAPRARALTGAWVPPPVTPSKRRQVSILSDVGGDRWSLSGSSPRGLPLHFRTSSSRHHRLRRVGLA